MSIHQISVFMENRAGELAEITGILAENHINLRALSVAETQDYGVLRVIVDDAARATAVLQERGFVFSMTPVTAVQVPDRAGGLAPVLRLLADHHIDIAYMYSLFTHIGENAYMVFRVEEEERFVRIMQENGIRMAGSEELGLR